MQCPSPSLVYPVGHGFGRDAEPLISTQFPFPSLLNPVAQTSGIDDFTQFPSPSGLKPVEQIIGSVSERGELGIVIGMHPP
jgi:hypothetical protein